MKKLLLPIFLFSVFRLQAQVITNYAVTAGSNQSLEDMSSGTTTLIGANQGPASSTVTSIGFEVYFMGIRFTDFSVNAGGVLRFGTTVINNNANTMNIAGHHRVCAFANSTPGTLDVLLWRTHSTGKVHYKVVGTAPNRRLVVEWLNMSIDGSSTTSNATWQAHIFETAPGNTDGGVVRIIFGQMNVGIFSNPVGCTSGLGTRTGIGYGENNDQFIAMDTDQHPTVTGTAISYTSTNESCFTSSPILLNSASNGSRRFYNFNPAAPNGNITSFSADCISANSIRLLWAENATNELGYLLYRSTDNVNFSLVATIPAGATEYIDTGLTQSTTYYYRLYVYNEGKISALSASGSLTEATLPASLASIISIKSGNWNDPTVWTSGTVPTATDNVVIGCTGNHTVTITSAATAAFTNNTPVSIPDNTPSGGVATGNDIPTAASLTGCATCAYSQVTVPAGTYSGVYSLNFSITHTFTADLDIYLLAPDGTVFLVSTDNGGSGDNYTNTTIQDGNPLISTGAAPFTGTYSLEVGTLASYAGTYVGNWRLYAIDDLGFDVGSITNFTLNLSVPAAGGAVCNNLTINNGSTLQYANNNALTVNGNLMNNGTLNLSGTNTTLDVKGNFTNNQNFVAGNSSNVIFSGNGVQNITHTPTGITQIARSNNTSINIPDNTPNGGVATGNTIPTAASLTGCATCAYREVTIPTGLYTGIHSLSFSIEHIWVEDLDIYLLAPDGTVFLVSTDNGGSGDNYTNTTIQDGNPLISTGSAPFTGTYSLEVGTLASYTGPYAGNWRLYAIDDDAIITGSITSFTLRLNINQATPIFHNLTMNGNTYAFLTNSNIAIAGTGTFTNGLLGTGTYRVDFLAGSASAGGSNNSYIVGLARKIGNTPFIFPIGASGYYAGIGFAPSGTTALSDHFTASYTRVVPNPYNIAQKEASIDHVGNCEYWMLDRTNGSQSATVSLHFDDTRSCGVDNLSQLIVCRWNGTQWTNGGNGGIAGSFVQSSTTFTTFSPFTLGSTGVNNPLPVGLVSFKAKGVESNALISWETSFELNTKNFVVERSLNGKDFEAITTQDALGRANTYQFVDRGIGVKFMQVYYRLKSIDTDGKYTYSPIEVVNFGEKQFALIAIQPNPIQKDFAVVYDVPANGKVQISITDALGKLVDKQIVEAEAGTNQYQYGNTDHLANGVYILSLQYEGQSISKKIVK